jgi:hypothetical protein
MESPFLGRGDYAQCHVEKRCLCTAAGRKEVIMQDPRNIVEEELLPCCQVPGKEAVLMNSLR